MSTSHASPTSPASPLALNGKRPAHWGLQALAFALDCGVFMGGVVMFSWLPRMAGLKVGPLGFLAFLALAGYQFWAEGTTGQSIGKRALRVRTVDLATGLPIGIGRAILRRLCHIADSAPFLLGWFLPLIDKQRQTLADKIMGTVVIHATTES